MRIGNVSSCNVSFIVEEQSRNETVSVKHSFEEKGEQKWNWVSVVYFPALSLGQTGPYSVSVSLSLSLGFSNHALLYML